MSRLGDIQTAVAIHAQAAFTAASEMLTVTDQPVAWDDVPKDLLPRAYIYFTEEEPERLAFKQQRRRVGGLVNVCMVGATMAVMNNRLEAIRDLIFDDETLTSTVDDITVEASVAYSDADDEKTYGTLDIATEEVF